MSREKVGKRSHLNARTHIDPQQRAKIFSRKRAASPIEGHGKKLERPVGLTRVNEIGARLL
jgi:hypothetical protein